MTIIIVNKNRQTSDKHPTKKMNEHPNETSNDIATKVNVDASNELQNVVPFSNEETIPRCDTMSREAGAACPTKFMDWSEERFTDDAVMKRIPAAVRHAEYDAFARENEETRRNDNDTRASREFEAHLEIESGGGRSWETGNFEMKAEEPSPEMSLVSVSQGSAVKNSEERLVEKMVDLASRKKRIPMVDREENGNPSSVDDTLDESSFSKETRRDESFGTVSKIREISTGGELATQSRRDETKKDVGLSPENDSTLESTIFLTRS